MNKTLTKALAFPRVCVSYIAGAGKKTYTYCLALQDRVELASTPRLSVKEQTFFVKRLAFLVRASVPILESLHMVSEQSTSRRYARVIKKVIADVAEGQSLAKSLGKFQHIFGDFGVNIVKVGETSGTLSQNLDYLADELKKRSELRSKIISAFIYPVIIACATLAITLFLMLYLFPKITPIFSSLHMALPLSTRIVMAVSVFLQNWWIPFLIFLVLFSITVVTALKRSKRFHFFFDQWMLSLPVLGPVVRSYNIANATRTLGLLLKSGVTLSAALPLTADTTKNLVYKAEFKKIAESINRGERISVHLQKKPILFPEVMSQMTSIGERSGNLSNTLVYLAELYEGEVDDFTKNLSSLIEPAMMVTMGLVVGFIAVSIITPIYGITQNLHP